MKKFRAAPDGTAHARVAWLLMLGTAFLAGGCQDPVPTEAPSVKAVVPYCQRRPELGALLVFRRPGGLH